MPRNRPDRAWLRRHARLLGGVVPADPDLAAAATALMAVLHHGEPLAWDPELEPATGFAVAPLEGRRTPDLPRRPWPDPSPGTLAADIAAAAAGADPQALAHPYRQRVSAWNPTLAAFITPCPPHHPQGQPQAQGPLFGAALAVKDIIQTAELTTTGGSALLADHIPHQDAAVWARLRAAGALCLGKTNTHEFAAGTTNVNDTYGPVRNPHDPSRISGGSSGGSAAAVAVGMAPAALGTDTAGSIRIPAACCGVVGLKPTYGRVSRAGVFPLSWSLDHVGPIAGSVRDVATLLAAMADPAAGPSLPAADTLGRPLATGLSGLRIGVPYSWLEERGDAAAASGRQPVALGVSRRFSAVLERIRGMGAMLVPVTLGSADRAVAVNRIINLAESATVHAATLHSNLGALGPAVRGRLWAGRCVAAEDYLQAQRSRRSFAATCTQVLVGPRAVHVLATPTLPIVAPPLPPPVSSGQALLRFCAPFNLLGWPALTLPCGHVRGLPVGLQLVAGPFEEDWLLAVAATIEDALA